MLYKQNWDESKKRFEAWWARENDRPLLWVVAKKDKPVETLEAVVPPKTPEALHLDVERKSMEMRNFCRFHTFMGESFPHLSADLGPGSLALYLGCEPVFAWDTLWYKECVEDWVKWGALQFDENNIWWKKHLSMVKQAKELSNGAYLVDIPDIIENVDILSAMRGPQSFCYDLVDQPDLMEEYIKQVDSLYFKYYDAFYEIVKAQDDSSSYTAFNIWGPGKTAKIQCDFCALMSPAQFRGFAQPSLRLQCQRLTHSLYHLDGPDAIKHLDALMEIEELDALQWTAGAGQPDGSNPRWYTIYDKVKQANKGIWTSIYDGGFQNWLAGADKLVQRYGSQGLYFIFPTMTEKEADTLMEKAEKDWK